MSVPSLKTAPPLTLAELPESTQPISVRFPALSTPPPLMGLSPPEMVRPWIEQVRLIRMVKIGKR